MCPVPYTTIQSSKLCSLWHPDINDCLSIYIKYLWCKIKRWIYFISIINGRCKILKHFICLLGIYTPNFFCLVNYAKNNMPSITIIKRTYRLIHIFCQIILRQFKFNIYLFAGFNYLFQLIYIHTHTCLQTIISFYFFYIPHLIISYKRGLRVFPETCQIFILFDLLELTSFVSFLNTYSYSDSSTYHWVVTHTDKSHHLYVSWYGRRSCELCI